MKKVLNILCMVVAFFSFVSLTDALTLDMSKFNTTFEFDKEEYKDKYVLSLSVEDYFNYLNDSSQTYSGELKDSEPTLEDKQTKGSIMCDVKEGNKCEITHVYIPENAEVTYPSREEAYDVTYDITLFSGASMKVEKGATVKTNRNFIMFVNSSLKIEGTFENNKIISTSGSITGQVSGKGKIEVFTNMPTLSVTANSNATNTVKLSGLEEGAKYLVYRATSKSGKYSKVATLSMTKDSYVDTGLKVGSTYYYKVSAYKTINSKNYYTSYTSVKSAKAKLAAPTVTVTSKDKTTLTVKWDKVSGASGYVVYRATSKNGKYKAVKTTTSTSYTDKKLTTGKTYYYKVRAYKTVSKKKYYGTYSSIKNAVPNVGAPTIKVSSYDYDSLKITITKVSGASGYAIYRSTGTGAYKLVTTTTKTSYIDKKLTTGEKYNYKVKAYAVVSKKKKYGSYGEVVSATPQLKTPTISVTNASATSLKINIGKVNGATSYELYRKDSKGEFEVLRVTNDSVNYDEQLTLGSEYSYKVVAILKKGETTIKSAESTVVTKTVKPAPINLSMSVYTYDTVFLGMDFDDVTKENKDKVTLTLYRKTSKDSEYTVLKKGTVTELVTETESYQDDDNYDKKFFVYENCYNEDGSCEYYGDYTDSSLKFGETYYYAVTTTIDGVESEKQVKSIKIDIIPVYPYAEASAYNKVTLNYGTSGATGYEVYRATSKKGTYKKVYSGTKESYTEKGPLNKTYYYKVRPYRVVSGKKVYGNYSEIISHKFTIGTVNYDGQYYAEVSGAELYIGKLDATYKSISGSTVKYNFKLTFKKTYSSKARTIKLYVYYYDNKYNQVKSQTIKVKIPKGTKKNWSYSFTASLSNKIIGADISHYKY